MLSTARFILVAITLFVIVIALDVFKFELLSSTLELSLVPAITLSYWFFCKKRDLYLTIFFMLYSVADIINILDFKSISNWSYFVCNMLYIAAYFVLMLYITKSMNLKLIFKNFLFDFVVLLLIDMYLVYVLISIVKPVNFLSNYVGFIQFVEFVYSLILITVLSLSFLNFVQNAVSKHFFLFVSCVMIAFSELILIGYYYVFDDIRISYASTVLFVCGMLMLFYHTFIGLAVKNKQAVNPLFKKI